LIGLLSVAGLKVRGVHARIKLTVKGTNEEDKIYLQPRRASTATSLLNKNRKQQTPLMQS